MKETKNKNHMLAVVLSIILTGAFSTVLIAKEKISDFTLKDYNGSEHSLSDYQNAKAVVLMFIATKCPVSNAYNNRMVKLYDDYQPKGVAFVGINSNKAEGAEEVKKHSQEHSFEFAVLKDPNNVIANRFGATVTPEIYVFSPDLALLYHGRIDDSQRESEIETSDLRNALDEILQGKAVAVAETKAFGCTIKKVD
jgi:peroxiredoxin